MQDIRRRSRVEIERVDCREQVVVDRYESNAAGLLGHEHFEIASLSLRRSTGEIQGRGPGWLASVRFATAADLLPAGPTHPRSASFRDRLPLPDAAAIMTRVSAKPAPSRLRYVRVDFQRELKGNLVNRQVNVSGQVHTVYGPVDSWDQAVTVGGPRWQRGGTAVNCDFLSLTQYADGPRRVSWFDLQATGNVKIEGFTPSYGAFTADAERLTYDQRKDLVVLDGGSHDARIWAESSAGLPAGHHAARKIFYWRSRNQIVAKDGRTLDLSWYNE
jgi:hypothetical protein